MDKDYAALLASQQVNNFQSLGATRNQMQAAPKPPMSMLGNSVDGLRTLMVRLNGLADQLAGVEPDEASNGILGISGGGVFGEVERYAQEIDELVGTMARHLSRIERRL